MQTEQDLEKLVRTYTPALLRYCTGILGSEHDAQDAVQQTFIKAWQHRHTLRRQRINHVVNFMLSTNINATRRFIQQNDLHLFR